MNENDTIRLKHRLDAAIEAVKFAGSETRETLENNRVLALALVKEIEIVGEATSKVSPECREDNPQIPWRDIVDMRNHLIHAYFKVDLDQVWSTLQDDLPPLIDQLTKILSNT
jgi:uncharacterized protein with HEPN domain